MGFKIGSVDVANEIVELQYKLHKQQILLEKLINGNRLTQTDLDEADTESIEYIKEKFPDVKIERRH